MVPSYKTNFQGPTLKVSGPESYSNCPKPQFSCVPKTEKSTIKIRLSRLKKSNSKEEKQINSQMHIPLGQVEALLCVAFFLTGILAGWTKGTSAPKKK